MVDKMLAAFQSAWNRCFDYGGRSSRGDYWWFALANLIIGVVLILLSYASDLFGWLYSIYTVVLILPSLPLAIRRLRDSGRHWAWILVSLIPLIGTIWLIYLLVQPSVAI